MKNNTTDNPSDTPTTTITTPTTTTTDYISDPNLSLKEKLARRLREKKAAGKPYYIDPAVLNLWGPWVVLFLLVGGGGWGTLVAMPVLYQDLGHGWLLLLLGRLWALVMVLQASANWFLMRWVSSEYFPALHGTKPEDELNSCGDKYNGVGDGSYSTSLSPRNNNTTTATTAAYERSKSKAEQAPPGVTKEDSSKKPAKKKKKNGTYHDGHSYTMWVAVALPDSEGRVERKPFPYWAWVPCLMCQRLRPPRCHHCVLCKQCVLKRDHHCYITGVCIGVNNHRFFLVFLFWAFLLTVFGSAHMLPYTFYHVVPEYHVHALDFFPPFSLVRGLLGYVSLVVPLLSLIFWLLLFFSIVSGSMLVNFVYMLLKGMTTFERDCGIKVTDTRPISGVLRSVFGERWWLNLLWPTYPWITPDEDAVRWPHIKPC